MDRTDIKVLKTLADSNLNITECARKLYMHRNTVVYHVNRIYKETNLNPIKFYDMCKLLGKIGHGNPMSSENS